ncbi:hypothetical protein GCM10007111_42460 [Virgibacillus kapii]|uniref:Uncharacterized protein n=1 Tax=Virgibacillus kapii TaxID=1638645 RepID=A0ABQ2DYP5_9BACI|nr:hypothetical protein GCM10007111_42460 [Virgibacillus kapii]
MAFLNKQNSKCFLMNNTYDIYNSNVLKVPKFTSFRLEIKENGFKRELLTVQIPHN